MRCLGGHSRVGGQLSASPYSLAPTKNAIARRADGSKGESLLQTAGQARLLIYRDAARHVATKEAVAFGKGKWLIKIILVELRDRERFWKGDWGRSRMHCIARAGTRYARHRPY